MNELALSFDKKLSKGKLAIIDIGSNSIRLVAVSYTHLTLPTKA